MSEREILFDLDDFKLEKPRGTWLDGKIAHLSASSLGMFRACPRQWQQRYIHGRKEPPGEGIVIGNFFHETMNWNYGQKIVSHEDRPLSEVIQYLQDKAVPDVLDKAGGAGEIRWDLSDTTKALDVARSDSQRITTAYHAQVLPRMQPVATEQRLEWHITGIPVPVIGFLDVIIPSTVVDTKTGKKVFTSLKPSHRLQADIYAANTGLDVEFHAINRAASPRIVTALDSEGMVVHPSQQALQNLVAVIRQLCDQIQWMYDTLGPDGEWPTLGRYSHWTQTIDPCSWCGYRADPCPAWA